MAYEIILAPEAVEDLQRLPVRERSMVRDAIERHLRHEPEKVSQSSIKRLREIDRPQYRLRVSEIRVFYDVSEGTVEILALVPKSEPSQWLDQFGGAP